MDRLALFIPLAKADAAQRLVYGYFDETPDRAGEVFDYASSKPNIQAWSGEIAKASAGKSYGNIRAQHGRNACGKLVDISFDDDLRKVGFVARIVDDDEWRKVEEGVYTGFSPGGRYARRWQDGAARRYTADIRELSIVDVPCNPAATFTMVKADGVAEPVRFALAKAYEPGNDATLQRAGMLARAAGKPARRNDFVAKARAQLIAENADGALAAMAVDADDRPDPAGTLDAALAKADRIIDASTPFQDLAKAADALRLLGTDHPSLAKGLCAVSSLAELIQQFACLQAAIDGEGALPAQAVAIGTAMGELLIAMAQDAVADLLAASPNEAPITVDDGDDADMALARRIIDLVKADTTRMDAAAARNDTSDQGSVQAVHDHAVRLGAHCAPAEKDALVAITADRDRLAKAVEASVPRVEALMARLETATAEIDALKRQPEPAKGRLIVMEKGHAPANADETLAERIAALPNGPVKQAAILASVGTSWR